MTDKQSDRTDDETRDESPSGIDETASNASVPDSKHNPTEELIDDKTSTGINPPSKTNESTVDDFPAGIDSESIVKPFGIDVTQSDIRSPDQSTLQTTDFSSAENTHSELDDTADSIDLDSDDPAEKTVSVAGTGRGPEAPDRQNESTIVENSDDANDATVVLGHVDPKARTVVKKQSPDRLQDRDIQETINPRELSDEDAMLWNSLLSSSVTGSAGRGDSTRIRPAIERTITETNLQIRKRDVVTPRHDRDAPSDYRLLRLLGKGGMGNVFVAKQASLDRLIAVKVIKPLDDAKQKKLRKKGRLKQVQQDRRHQFLSEAVVTGDLDHPNIVPIYDIAVAGDDTLFYAMKRVVGTPWSKVIKDKSLLENVEILLKVADAIGFAHTRCVVHRDIKPENIMLGDFGVVLVMDWGLALAQPDFEKIESIAHTAGLGGTPAFMAPEMAKGPINNIGPASDIYLLGATLFLIITGKAPHQAANISQCIKAVAVNDIIEVEEHHRGELMNIALKAMATRPKDRYADVNRFQQAIRDYLSHSESISLSGVANRDLNRAINEQSYNDFSRATHGFEQAIRLWRGNSDAKKLLERSRVEHAKAALAKEDFDLGMSLLEDSDPRHKKLLGQLREGARERDQRESRLKLFRRLAVAMLAVILIGGSLSIYSISNQRDIARAENERANEQADIAEDRADALAKANGNLAKANKDLEEANKAIASEKEKVEAEKIRVETAQKNTEEQRKRAVREKDRKEEQRALAQSAREAEATARKQAEYEAYLSQIGLAKARVEQNEFTDARRILGELRDKRGEENLGWEWRWLWHQSNQSKPITESNAPLKDLSQSKSQHAVALSENGMLEILSIAENRSSFHATQHALKAGRSATAVAISADGQWIAVGRDNGVIEIWDRNLSQMQRRLIGHEGSVSDVHFLKQYRVVSSSFDRTVRVWDHRIGKQTGVAWHIAPVVSIALRSLTDRTLIAAAASDKSSGRVVVWKLGSANPKPQRIGEYKGHNGPVTAVAISRSGRLAASADANGQVLLWNPRQTTPTDYEGSLKKALKLVSGRMRPLSREAARTQIGRPLADPSLAKRSTRFVSTTSSKPKSVRSLESLAHTDAIKSLAFSDDESQLISASDDYTIKVWDPSTRQLRKTLRGHGGWVTGAQFLAGTNDQVISISKDASVRTWDLESYLDETTLIQKYDSRQANNNSQQLSRRQTTAHQDEIWSARFDPSGEFVVSASRDHTARILRVDRKTMTFKQSVVLNDPSDAANSRSLVEGSAFRAMSAVVDHANGRLFVGSADSTVRIWDLATGTQLWQLTGTGLNTKLALSKNGRLLVTGSSSPASKAILWGMDPNADSPPVLIYRIKGHEEAVTAFAISPNGRMIFTGDRVGRGWLWDTASGSKIGDPIEDTRGYRINDVQFTSDGLELLIAADDQQLTRIDVRTRQRTRRYSHDGLVTQVSLSADGSQAITVSESSSDNRFLATAQLWNLADGLAREIERLETPIGRPGTTQVSPAKILDATFAKSAQSVAIATSQPKFQSGRVRILNVDSGDSKSFDLPARLGNAYAAMPLAKDFVLTLNGDGAFLWNTDTMVSQRSFRAHAALTQASFSFDSKFVATASRSVKIWSSSTGKAIGKLENPHLGAIRAVDFSPAAGSYQFATAGDDGWVRVWKYDPNSTGFAKQHEFALLGRDGDSDAPLPVRTVRFSPNGQSILAAGAAGTAIIWTLADRVVKRYHVKDAGAFTCCDFSPDGQWIALGSEDKKSRLYRIDGQEPFAQEPIVFEGHADQIRDVKILQDRSSAMRVLTASLDKSARIWDPRIASEESEIQESEGRELVSLRKHQRGVTAIDVSRDGDLVMTAGLDGVLILWPAATEVPGPLR